MKALEHNTRTRRAVIMLTWLLIPSRPPQWMARLLLHAMRRIMGFSQWVYVTSENMALELEDVLEKE